MTVGTKLIILIAVAIIIAVLDFFACGDEATLRERQVSEPMTVPCDVD